MLPDAEPEAGVLMLNTRLFRTPCAVPATATFSPSNHSSWLAVVVGSRHAIMQIAAALFAISLTIPSSRLPPASAAQPAVRSLP